VLAQAGSLDPTFGDGGIVISTTGVFPGTATLDAAGNILIAGTAGDGQPGEITRFLVNGQLDTSFGAGGVVTTPIPMQLSTIVVQADGKILGGGFTNPENATEYFALVRYNSNGTLDSTFGKGGFVVTLFPPPVTGGGAQVIVEQPDGKIVAGGASAVAAVVRYNPDGSLDQTFGNGGIFLGGVNTLVVTVLALQSNGTILYDWALGAGLQELSPEGKPEPRRVGTIVAVSNIDGSEVMQENGDLVVASQIPEGTASGRVHASRPWSQAPSRQQVKMQRYLPSGAFDPTFDNPPFYWQPEPSPQVDLSYVAATALPADGQIVIGGWSTTASGGLIALGRLNSTGTFDPTFGAGGIVLTQILNSCSISRLLLQPSGNIVAIGIASATGASSSNLVLARYLSE
jgi:uncharacterized delta-60 repeat protein